VPTALPAPVEAAHLLDVVAVEVILQLACMRVEADGLREVQELLYTEPALEVL
jgi:hypothetical protein